MSIQGLYIVIYVLCALGGIVVGLYIRMRREVARHRAAIDDVSKLVAGFDPKRDTVIDILQPEYGPRERVPYADYTIPTRRLSDLGEHGLPPTANELYREQVRANDILRAENTGTISPPESITPPAKPKRKKRSVTVRELPNVDTVRGDRFIPSPTPENTVMPEISMAGMGSDVEEGKITLDGQTGPVQFTVAKVKAPRPPARKQAGDSVDKE